MRTILRLGAWLVTGVLSTACTGEILTASETSKAGPSGTVGGTAGAPASPGQPGGASGSTTSPSSPGVGPKNDPQCTQLHPGVSPLRRLTRQEYSFTLHDVLNDDADPGGEFPPDGAANGFHNAAAQSTVSQLAVDKLQQAAETVSARALKNERSRVLGGCDPAKDGEDACVTSFLARTGRRLFRRPLTADEDTSLRAVIAWGRQERSYDKAIELALQVMLQHPSFLYRLELSADAPTATKGVVKLSGYEVATRLSYLLWATAPDDALLDQAKDGKLETAAQVRATAETMLKDDRTRRTLRSFHDQWLEIEEVAYAERNTAMFPQYSKELVASMHEETARFVESLFFEGDRKISTLLSARWTYADAGLAKLYGVTPPAGGGFAKVDLGPTQQRAGILTHASVMTSHAKFDRSAPVLRGRFVRQRLLCVPIPDPDMNVMGLFPDIDPTNLTTRQYFEEHVKNPACSGCHDLMDPIGFGFEHYDAVGAWRALEKGKPVDASGSLDGAGSVDGDYNGAVELADKLAHSTELSDCLASQWFRYGAGRAEGDEDSCSLGLARARLTTSGGDLRELLLALTETDAFLYRTTTDGVAP